MHLTVQHHRNLLRRQAGRWLGTPRPSAVEGLQRCVR
jgi:hypothetical protein